MQGRFIEEISEVTKEQWDKLSRMESIVPQRNLSKEQKERFTQKVKRPRRIFKAIMGATFKLEVIGERVPQKGDLYLNMFGEVQRCLEDSTSSHAKKRIILKEEF